MVAMHIPPMKRLIFIYHLIKVTGIVPLHLRRVFKAFFAWAQRRRSSTKGDGISIMGVSSRILIFILAFILSLLF